MSSGLETGPVVGSVWNIDVYKRQGLRHVRLRLNATRLLDSSEELQHRFVGGVLREKGHGFNFL